MPKTSTTIQILEYTFLDTEINFNILEIVRLAEQAIVCGETKDGKAALARLEGLKGWMNVYNEKYLTAGFLLASKGKRKECELLANLGADLAMIAAGAAYSADVAYVNELIQQMMCVEGNMKANFHKIAVGAVYGGKLELANVLIERLGGDTKADLKNIAAGAAMGGHLTIAYSLIERLGGDINVNVDKIATIIDQVFGQPSNARLLRTIAFEQQVRKMQAVRNVTLLHSMAPVAQQIKLPYYAVSSGQKRKMPGWQ